jgi:uncharacterized protein DUF4249
MNTKIIFTGLSSVVLLFSCQKVVTLNLDTVPPQVVIQGEVTDQPGPYTVTIGRSVNFYADNVFPAVSGAVVQISDGQGITDSLTETSPGRYVTHVLAGRPGNTYTLSVTVGDTSYTAVSTMPSPVPLDSVTLEHTKGRFGRKDQITPQANYQDPAGVKNYYQYVLNIDGVQFTNDIFAFSDRLTDGKYLTQDLRMDSSYLAPGDQLRVDMYCIDANVYNYFNQLSRSTGTGAFNTAAAPANPSTNISNGAYGVFSAHTLRSVTVTVY